ncbi:MAG: DNA polymerase IV, partial [Proteobacteria bacterium]|nr:DNA polymerase IV [Pseudomonadota bacterium]
MKTISSETTFFDDLSKFEDLESVLWRQAERVSTRAKDHELAGRTVVLKLKTANFKLKTRSASLEAPTQLADRIFRVARDALKREADGTKYRLLGVGISNLAPAHQADPLDLIDRGADKRAAAERAIDKLRGKFGAATVGKGRGIRLDTRAKK